MQISAYFDKDWQTSSNLSKISQNWNLPYFLYKRSYQNCEFQSAITFEQKLILTFLKKHLLPLKEIFQMRLTLFFDPAPLSPQCNEAYESVLVNYSYKWDANLGTFLLFFFSEEVPLLKHDLEPFCFFPRNFGKVFFHSFPTPNLRIWFPLIFLEIWTEAKTLDIIKKYRLVILYKKNWTTTIK